MFTPDMGHKMPPGAFWWAADTGCYSQGDAFDLTRYLTWLESRRQWRLTCLFATAPDVVGDAEATLARSLPVLPVIRAQGYKAALVAQDGQESLPAPWDAFDCLFVGGTTKWKLSAHAYALVAEARARGKWTHMGRVNSERRLRAARVGGYDSADGTYLAFGPDINTPRLMRWLDTLARQGAMELSA